MTSENYTNLPCKFSIFKRKKSKFVWQVPVPFIEITSNLVRFIANRMSKECEKDYCRFIVSIDLDLLTDNAHYRRENFHIYMWKLFLKDCFQGTSGHHFTRLISCSLIKTIEMLINFYHCQSIQAFIDGVTFRQAQIL